MIEGRATARYVRGSAQKAKLVMDLIRGRAVNDALATLRYSRKGVARDVSKVLRSAVANAQQKEGASGDVDRLVVGSCHADQGPSLKRIRAAPMGRAFRIIKRTAHLTVTVRERPEKAAPVVAVGADQVGSDAPTAPKRVRRKTVRKKAARTAASRKKATAKSAKTPETTTVVAEQVKEAIED